MTMSYTINTVFQQYHQEILQELHRAFLTQNASLREMINNDILLKMYGQMQYHLGWVDQHLRLPMLSGQTAASQTASAEL